MNDKEKKSNSNDKSIAETVEDLFDDFFAPKKSDISHDAKKRRRILPLLKRCKKKLSLINQ
jgi:hypothetical protein